MKKEIVMSTLPKPGRALDALVAKYVFEMKYWGSQCWGPNRTHITELPRYSEDIAAAWEVLAALEKQEHFVCTRLTQSKKGWKCNIDANGFCLGASAPTAPHAICLAALAAAGKPVEANTPRKGEE